MCRIFDALTFFAYLATTDDRDMVLVILGFVREPIYRYTEDRQDLIRALVRTTHATRTIKEIV
jgi:hypothetical protein